MTEPIPDPAEPLIAPSDLVNFATIDAGKAADMCEDALGQAEIFAPCIFEEGFAKRRAAKSVLRGAILRWHESGQGAAVTKSAGIYGQTVDTRQPRKAMFFPSEIDALQKLCRIEDEGGAFAIDTLPRTTVQHAQTCSLNLGGATCSCGAYLTGSLGYPLYENDGWA